MNHLHYGITTIATRALVVLLLIIAPVGLQAQNKAAKGAGQPAEPELTEEELAAIAQEEHRAKLIEEMLPNTRDITIVDTLVTDKDNFLAHLRLSSNIGRYTTADELMLPPDVTGIGSATFINSLGGEAYLSIADSTGNLHLSVAYRNADSWLLPTPIEGLQGFTYQDYPFLHPDGRSLYFAATGEESIGGLDIFATRYNEDTRQFVRPQNMGFPFNSPANDYLLAIDEELGIGALVSDRYQPDDKVCIYWFIARDHYETLDPQLLDAEDDTDEAAADAETPYECRAHLSRVALTQQGHEDEIALIRRQWTEALGRQSSSVSVQRFIINDTTVYTQIDEFKSPRARELAQRWVEAVGELQQMERLQDQLRRAYAQGKPEPAKTLAELEHKLQTQRERVKQLAKDYRAEEMAGLTKKP